MDEVTFVPQLKTSLKDLLDKFSQQLKRTSVGRVHPSMLDNVTVAVEETKLSLKQLATILIQEAITLKITPFDNTNIKAIYETLYNDSELNFNLTDDGRSIYATIPPMTSDRRQQIIKQLQGYKEDFSIRLRQQRHQVLKQIKEAELSDDKVHSLSKQVEELTSETKDSLEQLAQQKIDEITNI